MDCGSLKQTGGFVEFQTACEEKRHFLPAWLYEYKWLKEVDEKMYCEICNTSGRKNPFTATGCHNFQKSAPQRHQNSKDHIMSLRKSFQVTVSNATKNVEKQTEELMRREQQEQHCW